jgi:hypothetical protein
VEKLSLNHLEIQNPQQLAQKGQLNLEMLQKVKQALAEMTMEQIMNLKPRIPRHLKRRKALPPQNKSNYLPVKVVKIFVKL